jgi:predicted dithiol-disulfide oxidoreductase (DUF899 family)
MATLTHDVRFPNESEAYRAARDALLQEEVALRAQVERVARLRRSLPPGGAVPEDYAFDELDAAGRPKRVRMSELFAPGKGTLITYNFMFGPRMEEPCPNCTSLVDGFDGVAVHLQQRVDFAVVARSPIERLAEVGRSRGWRRVRLLSSSGNAFSRDYHGELEDGAQMPVLSVFERTPGGIVHFYSTELVFMHGKIDGDPRHVDSVWPLWNFLDFTREGRGTDWYPRLRYER